MRSDDHPSFLPCDNIEIQPNLKAEFFLVYFSSPSLNWIKTAIKLFSTGYRGVSLVDWKQFGGWGGGEEWGRCSHNYTRASQRYLQPVYPLRRCSWCCDQIFEDRECFLPQMKCMMSASVEIIFYWAWLIISVRVIEPKLKETTVNHFASRHYWWIEVFTWVRVKQYARIVWASLLSSLEVSGYDCLLHRFSPTFQPPLFSVEN